VTKTFHPFYCLSHFEGQPNSGDELAMSYLVKLGGPWSADLSRSENVAKCSLARCAASDSPSRHSSIRDQIIGLVKSEREPIRDTAWLLERNRPHRGGRFYDECPCVTPDRSASRDYDHHEPAFTRPPLVFD
jgi:hypothetical protein